MVAFVLGVREVGLCARVGARRKNDEEATAGVVFNEAGCQPPTRLATHSFPSPSRSQRAGLSPAKMRVVKGLVVVGEGRVKWVACVRDGGGGVWVEVVGLSLIHI